MNGLGLAAFDFKSGSTSWRRALLPISSSGDTVQVDVTVANVGDNLFNSKVVVDFVEEVTKSLCIYSNVAEGVGSPALTAGNAALLVADDSIVGAPANVTTYALWPDANPAIVSNGADSDVRVNFALDDWKGYPYVYCEMISDRELAAFQLEVAKNNSWTCTNNSAFFASKVFKLITGTVVNATDLNGLATPRKIGKSIRALNGGSNLPPGGLVWASRRRRNARFLQASNATSSLDSCKVKR